jgi:hypothetical protein
MCPGTRDARGVRVRRVGRPRRRDEPRQLIAIRVDPGVLNQSIVDPGYPVTATAGMFGPATP